MSESQYSVDVRVIVKPHIEKTGSHRDRYDLYIAGHFLMTTKRPLADGARQLIKLGFSRNKTMTLRREGQDWDIWQPLKIGEAAKWTVTEDDSRGLRKVKWAPRPVIE